MAPVLSENLVNIGNHRHKNVVWGSILCRHNRGMPAKCADIWLSGRHVADMLATFPAKCHTHIAIEAIFLPCGLFTMKLKKLALACRIDAIGESAYPMEAFSGF